MALDRQLIKAGKMGKKGNDMEFLKCNPKWTRQPKSASIGETEVVLITEKGTDLWARTYYGFQNDNAPVLQIETTEKFFSFVVKTEFESSCRFDQCGVVMYLDSDNWFKASIEYENEKVQRLGSVVTNHGYSDWATTDISSDIKNMWYRFSRRESDFCVECSEDGLNYRQMRIFHMWEGAGKITYGINACSPTAGSITATISKLLVTECQWNSDTEWRV